jgi:hypothetical protein
LVGELGVDMRRVIVDREAAQPGVADQDLVQHLDQTWQLPSERSGVVTVLLSPAYGAVKMLTCIA